MGLSLPQTLRATLNKIKEYNIAISGNYLDIGSGYGDLISEVISEFKVKPYACDYTDQLMQLSNQSVDIVDLNKQKLPYNNNYFDLVTLTEVIEHLEDYRGNLKDIFRVLKPGGILVISTPNILNIKSRIRFLFFGFWNLFGPLHLQEDKKYTTGGHINPISYFYLAHSLSEVVFKKVNVSIDKKQTFSLFGLIFLWLPVKIFANLAFRKERNKYQTIDNINERFVREMNGLKLLLGRTLIVGCIKP